ncbi:MAG: response regulator [Bacteroidetes bacterium]|nr:response regulator [Bacteroidota bacterium]
MTTPSETTPHILIVEESDINRRLAAHVFTQAGYSAETVTNGHDAVNACLQHRYDFILMDCRLSDFPQFMATRMIRLQEERLADGRRVPIVGLTAFAPPGFHERCLRAGMDACFEKPFREETMHEIARRWLSAPAQAEPTLNVPSDRPPFRGTSLRALSGRFPARNSGVARRGPDRG